MMDPANDLYDSACELLAATQSLRRAAGRSGVDDALAPTLGCVQAALEELAVACARLRGAAAGAPARGEALRFALDAFEERLRLAEHDVDVARSAAAEIAAQRTV